MSRGRRTHDHEIIKNRDFDREGFCRLETELFHVNKSSYQPSRQLFARARHGHYLPNPSMHLRHGEGWVPVYDALGLDWLETGCRSDDGFISTPAGVVARLKSEVVEPQRDLDGE